MTLRIQFSFKWLQCSPLVFWSRLLHWQVLCFSSSLNRLNFIVKLFFFFKREFGCLRMSLSVAITLGPSWLGIIFLGLTFFLMNVVGLAPFCSGKKCEASLNFSPHRWLPTHLYSWRSHSFVFLFFCVAQWLNWGMS